MYHYHRRRWITRKSRWLIEVSRTRTMRLSSGKEHTKTSKTSNTFFKVDSAEVMKITTAVITKLITIKRIVFNYFKIIIQNFSVQWSVTQTQWQWVVAAGTNKETIMWSWQISPAYVSSSTTSWWHLIASTSRLLRLIKVLPLQPFYLVPRRRRRLTYHNTHLTYFNQSMLDI